MARNMRRFYEMFHVPAERMAYYYAFLEELPEPLNGVIGVVMNDTCAGLRILLEVDDDYMKQGKFYTPKLYVDPESYLSECRIIFTGRMARQLLKEDPELVFELWHEVGAFHTMEDHVEAFLNYANRTETGYTAEEYLAIVNGEVLPHEAAADDFAVDYCGGPESVIAVNGMIAQAKKNPATMNDRGLVRALLNRKNRITGQGGSHG